MNCIPLSFAYFFHFRGFDEYYSIPFGDETAERGHWEKGPGMELFHAGEVLGLLVQPLVPLHQGLIVVGAGVDHAVPVVAVGQVVRLLPIYRLTRISSRLSEEKQREENEKKELKLKKEREEKEALARDPVSCPIVYKTAGP